MTSGSPDSSSSGPSRLRRERTPEPIEDSPVELARRESGGIEVSLWWSPLSGRLAVSVVDHRGGDAFDVPARADEALEVFNHPYAYASALGVGRVVITSEGSRSGSVAHGRDGRGPPRRSLRAA
jgi:hypothetical protein